ncbi:Protein of unknown function [Propionibacterium freudenreichii subsp. freudenreichii]|uniref:Uncharacterized protein n=1 Tax=Propionibacterium freudenreichii subsp. freudenreichii TaxID=66712 RepID=A0A068VW49_PROFF|nr:Protein of unknown function [Propionibacterium freudenreichii subsp. freudenreichii]CEG93523.1 Protein of unknown function [Propionibacterium freudenreichii]CEG97563.1 Protein of unknown function [Propionibacterium freudenreichii]CEH05539.1 Protein of unknown function [Propionibacterium freudenreichii]CEI22131.1 Protein of unknown function [Propionibacterium freudenreichii]
MTTELTIGPPIPATHGDMMGGPFVAHRKFQP